MKRGDIFHDGIFGYWILHEKPRGRKLFLVPLDRLHEDPKLTPCHHYHDPKSRDLKNMEIVCNLYDNPEQAAGCIGDGPTLYEKLLSAYKAGVRYPQP